MTFSCDNLKWKIPASLLVVTLSCTTCVLGFASRAAAAPAETDGSGEPAAPAAADSDGERKEQARSHFKRGIEAYRAERYKDAIDSFLDANRIYPSPALSYNTARAYERLGDSAGALRFYRDYLRREPDASDRAEVEERIGALEQKLRERGVQQVTVLSEPEGSTVVIDGRPVGVTPWTGEIFPGQHRLELRLEGYEDAETEFELLPHRARDVSLELTKTPAPEPADPPPAELPSPEPSSTKRDLSFDSADRGVEAEPSIEPWTWAALGAGAGALGGALALELMSAGAEDEARGATTQIEAQDAVDAMQRRQTTARVLVGVGGALLATGGVLLFLDLKQDGEPETARLGAGCTRVACGIMTRGTF